MTNKSIPNSEEIFFLRIQILYRNMMYKVFTKFCYFYLATVILIGNTYSKVRIFCFCNFLVVIRNTFTLSISKISIIYGFLFSDLC